MGADASLVTSMFEKLKLDEAEDPCWLPPRPWESIPSESGHSSSSSSSTSHSQPPQSLYHTSAVSESSLVRLIMNALQGIESAIITIEKLCALFCSDSADRTSHRISSLWSQALSTLALGNLLKSIGRSGCTVLLLRKFVNYFTSSNSDGNSEGKLDPSKQTLVNQAFAVAVRKVLDAHISALNTLYASVSLRRSSKASDGGCLTSIGHSKITALEVHLHTIGLRTQIEALGNICNMNDIALSFSVLSFESLIVKASSECSNFPRGGRLLTFLYTQLKVAEPVHYALLKFLFIQSFEPYCGFIRSWIFEGQISDPYNEFVVEYVNQIPAHGLGNAGISTSPLAAVRVRDGVAIPCFLEEFLIPFFRAGQQLQVVMKLLELCNNVGACYATLEDILPHLNLSSECRLFASPLTFDKRTLQTRVLARNSYYHRMLENVEKILTKFEFRSQQALACDIQFGYAKKHISKLDHRDSIMDEGLVSPLSDGRDQNLPIMTVDSETSSIADEFSCGEDLLDSSESTSLNGSEEQNDELMMHNLHVDKGLLPSYLSALDFSFSFQTDNPLQKPPQSEILRSMKSGSCTTCEKKEIPGNGLECTNMVKTSSDVSLPYVCGEQHMPKTTDSKGANSQNDVCLAFGNLLEDSVCIDKRNSEGAWLHNVGYGLEVSSKKLGIHETEMLNYGDSIVCGSSSIGKANSEDHHVDGPCATHTSFGLLSWKLMYHPNFLSMNPILMKKYLLDSGSKHGERSCMNSRQPFSHFDFASVKDPFKICVERIATNPKQLSGFSVSTDAVATTAPCMSDHLDKEGCGDEKREDITKLSYVYTPLGLKTKDGKKLTLTAASGSSGWESLLGGFSEAADVTAGDPRTSSVVAFDMPLDFVIKKCLWEEISLQYRFVSKLTIKLLEEGFDLQEHLLALRRYHFMEVADWADLFIMTLWHHKWYVTEADKRIPEIHGALELSVQRSSCEGDPNKNRLYLYIKGDSMNPLSTSAIGIHSFDFLGLGYRVDWPVNIILTPDALKIYSEIFNFLIQVKLAVFFLTDAWCLLKNLVQLTKKIHRSKLQKQEVDYISILLDTRHLVNHFVCTLQQYVQSQLSHVSWSRFLHSLKHKVKDMMDLESVHFAYLAESLHICFLSDETRPIANIIQNILQCAMDFRSCLIGSSLEAGFDEKTLLSKLSLVDIHQVLAIKKTFTKNVKDLYLLYLKSPKHEEFAISRFWNCLNYNDYYSEIIAKQIGRCALSV